MNRLQHLLGLDDPNGTAPEPQSAQPGNGHETSHAGAPPEKTIVPPPWRPFPVELLPEACRRFVCGTAGNIGCDESFVALPLLSALAGAIGNSRTIRLNSGWDEPAILWTAIVGESGTRKTPAIESVTRLLWDREHRNFREHRQALKQYREHKQLYDQQLALWMREEPSSHTPPEFDEPVPVCRRELVSDITVEALAAVMEENPRGLTLVRDELFGWLANFEGPRSRKGDDASDWLTTFGGRPLIVEQKSRKRPMIYVPHATMSLTGGIQPEVFREALQRMGNNGVGARLLIAHPPHRQRTWVQAVDTDALNAGLADLLDRLDRLGDTETVGQVSQLALEEESPEGTGKLENLPHDVELRALPLSAEAQEEWIAFYRRHAEELRELTGDIAAAWSKLEAYAARLALVVHVVRGVCGEADPDQIDAESMRAGVMLAEWFGNEVLRFYALFANSEDAAARLRLIALIQRRQGEITVRQLVQCDRRFRGNYVRAEIVLHELVEAGLGNWVFREEPGRRNRWVFRLNDGMVPARGAPSRGECPPTLPPDFFGNSPSDGATSPDV